MLFHKTALLILASVQSVSAFTAVTLVPRQYPQSRSSLVSLSSSSDESSEDIPDGEPFLESSNALVGVDDDDDGNMAVNDAESLDDAPSDVEEDLVKLDGGGISTTSTLPTMESAFSEATLTKLLLIAAATGRGEFATMEQKEQAEALIVALEAQNPTPDQPAQSPLALGKWELIYSSTQLFRSSPFFMAGRAVCSTPEQAKQYDWFCDMHRKALAISSIGSVRQIISPTRMVSEFQVQVGAIPFLSDFTPFRYSGGLPVTIEGAIVSSADITPNPTGTAWEIFMDTVEIKGSNIPGLRQLLDQGLSLKSRDLGTFLETNVNGYTNPRPIFEMTYLSESIRICREQDGKVFVYSKLSDDGEPSDYSKVDADLGILKLLEGFNDAITKFYI